MLNRINISNIIRAHLKTLRSLNAPDTAFYWPDVVSFLLLPVATAIGLYWLKLNLTVQVPNLIATISIFGGFLLNLLAIIYSYIDKLNTPNASEIRKRFASEINANISFCILLSVFIVLVLLVYGFLPVKICGLFLTLFSRATEATIYFLLTLFFLTLLMVLSRVFILLQKE